MATNIQVEKNSNENTPNLIRRFTRRVQGSGVLRRVRGLRYAQRPLSPLLSKKKKIAYLKRKATRDELVKLGKIPEFTPRGRFRKK